MIAGWLLLKSRDQSFRDLGTWRLGNWAGWSYALLFAGLTIASNLRFLPRMGIPISYAFAPRGFHLVAALATGITAGFCEELLFRGLLMTDFARAGYGKVVQVILPGISFGFSHLGYAVHGFVAGVGIMVPTAVLGMMWGVAYLLGRRATGIIDRSDLPGRYLWFSASCDTIHHTPGSHTYTESTEAPVPVPAPRRNSRASRLLDSLAVVADQVAAEGRI